MTPSESEYIEVTVKHGRKFLIDREDFAKHCQVAWRTRWNENSQNYYVVRSFLEKMPNGRWRCTSLQLGRVILGLERGDPRRVDHINGDPLDNRQINLRICTHTENMQNQRLPKNNTSGFKGVSAWKGRWMAQIMARGKHLFSGCLALLRRRTWLIARRLRLCMGSLLTSGMSRQVFGLHWSWAGRRSKARGLIACKLIGLWYYFSVMQRSPSNVPD